MTYLETLATERAARLERLSRRDPKAGPLVLKPQPRIIPLDKFGKRIVDAPPPPPVPKFLADPPPPPQMPKPVFNKLTVEQIVFVVARVFGLHRTQLTRHDSRVSAIVVPRQVAMFFAREMLPGMSLPRIALRMGRWDHTTVLHAVRAIPKKMQRDPQLAEKVEQIRTILREEIDRLSATLFLEAAE